MQGNLEMIVKSYNILENEMEIEWKDIELRCSSVCLLLKSSMWFDGYSHLTVFRAKSWTSKFYEIKDTTRHSAPASSMLDMVWQICVLYHSQQETVWLKYEHLSHGTMCCSLFHLLSASLLCSPLLSPSLFSSPLISSIKLSAKHLGRWSRLFTARIGNCPWSSRRMSPSP